MEGPITQSKFETNPEGRRVAGDLESRVRDAQPWVRRAQPGPEGQGAPAAAPPPREPERISLKDAIALAGAKPDRNLTRNDLLVRGGWLHPRWEWSRDVGLTLAQAIANTETLGEEYKLVGGVASKKMPKEKKEKRAPSAPFVYGGRKPSRQEGLVPFVNNPKGPGRASKQRVKAYGGNGNGKLSAPRFRFAPEIGRPPRRVLRQLQLISGLLFLDVVLGVVLEQAIPLLLPLLVTIDIAVLAVVGLLTVAARSAVKATPVGRSGTRAT